MTSSISYERADYVMLIARVRSIITLSELLTHNYSGQLSLSSLRVDELVPGLAGD